jgi:hypothetical protein
MALHVFLTAEFVCNSWGEEGPRLLPPQNQIQKNTRAREGGRELPKHTHTEQVRRLRLYPETTLPLFLVLSSGFILRKDVLS